MLEYAPWVVLPVLVWWLSTGLVLYLDGLPRSTHRWSARLATLALPALLYAFADASRDPSALGACLAFFYAVMIWGWLELTYLLGWLTGPRSEPCPPRCSLAQRFGLGVQTSLYHELATVVLGALMLALAAGGPNPFGAWAFAVLWAMRWSTKLNIFLGVPNLTEEFWPEHMRYLSSYCGHRPMNSLFPVSVTLATVVLVILVQAAAAATAPVAQAGFTMVATLMALALLEHWFLVLPVREAALWQWALDRRRGGTGKLELAGGSDAAITPPASTR